MSCRYECEECHRLDLRGEPIGDPFCELRRDMNFCPRAKDTGIPCLVCQEKGVTVLELPNGSTCCSGTGYCQDWCGVIDEEMSRYTLAELLEEEGDLDENQQWMVEKLKEQLQEPRKRAAV